MDVTVSDLQSTGEILLLMEERIPLLQSRLVAFQRTPESCINGGIRSSFDQALKRSFLLIEVLHSIQAVQGILTEDHLVRDLRRYLNVVCCLERYLQILEDSYAATMALLEEVVIFVKEKLSQADRAFADTTSKSDPQIDVNNCFTNCISTNSASSVELQDISNACNMSHSSMSKDLQLQSRESYHEITVPVEDNHKSTPVGLAHPRSSHHLGTQEIIITPFGTKGPETNKSNAGMDPHSQMQQLTETLLIITGSSYKSNGGACKTPESWMELLVVTFPQVKGLNLVNDATRVLHQALDKLEEEFQKLLVSNSSPMDLRPFLQYDLQGQADHQFDPLLESELLVKLSGISYRLMVNARAPRCLQIYKEARLRILRKGVTSLSPDYLQCSTPDALSNLKWEAILGFLPLWIQHLQILVQVLFRREMVISGQVLARLDSTERENCFTSLIHEQSSFLLFIRFAEALALSRHTPERRLCGLLDMFKAVQEMIKNVAAEEISLAKALRERLEELRKQLIHDAYKALWEIVKNVEMHQSDIKPDGGLDMLPSFVVNYLRTILEFYKASLEEVLRIQQSWRSEPSKQTGLTPIIINMMNALAKNLEERARICKDAAFAFLFLMNNYMYVVLKSQEYSELNQYLDKGWRIEWQRKVQDNARKYVQVGWEKVVTCLSSDAKPNGNTKHEGSSHSTNVMKSQLKAFYASFEATYNQHSQWTIPDPQLRMYVSLSVIQLVIPPYHGFCQHHASSLQGATARKCLKLPPGAMQNRLENLFKINHQLQKQTNGYP